jgi:hypothetical protein
MGEADVCANLDCGLSGATFRCARCHAVRYHNRAYAPHTTAFTLASAPTTTGKVTPLHSIARIPPVSALHSCTW